MLMIAVSSAAALAGCAAHFIGIAPGAVMGRIGVYDYSPSVIQAADGRLQFWWCGQGSNPNRPSQDNDTIQYATLNPATGKATQPVTVLGETDGAWDAAYVCNPRVIGGFFSNPLGDGETYSYAMYYVGTARHSGMANSIGVAFSNDGEHWKKYPQPVIVTSTQTYYGAGQPVAYNNDRKSGIRLFYENTNRAGVQHVEAISTDGVHFQDAGTLTTNGLNSNFPGTSWGDMAYDPKTQYWYASFNMNVREPSTTGNRTERGQLGVTLYRIPASSLLTGESPWEELHSYDTNGTGNESNFLAAFLRDEYGNVSTGPYPTIELFTSISNPKPRWNAAPGDAAGGATPEFWDIGVARWTPGEQLLPLNQYANDTVREATTGWIDPAGGFKLQSALGLLYEGPQNGATLAMFSCKKGATDYFVSTDKACEGQRILGIEGYGYAQPQAGQSLTPLYRCTGGRDHFLSSDSTCQGEDSAPVLLGYAIAE